MTTFALMFGIHWVALFCSLAGATNGPQGFSDAKRLPVKCITYSPDGKLLAIGSGYLRDTNAGPPWGGEGSLRVIDTKSFNKVLESTNPFTCFVGAVSFLDNQKIVTVSDEFYTQGKGRHHRGVGIRVYSIASDPMRAPILNEYHSNSTSLKFGFHPKTGSVCFFRLPYETVLIKKVGPDAIIRLHAGSAHYLCFSPDGKTVLSCAPDVPFRSIPYRNVRLYDVDTGNELSAYDPDESYVEYAQFSGDGKKVALSCKNGRIYVLTADLKTRLKVIVAKDSSRALSFGPDGETIAYRSGPDTVHLYDFKTRKVVRSFEKHSEGINFLSFSPDGTQLAVGGGAADGKGVITAPGCVRIWDANDGKLMKLLK